VSASTADWEEAGPDEAYRPLLEDSAEDLYEAAPCGYLSTLADGTIVKVNETFLGWTGYGRDELLRGRRVQELLTVGGRVFHETHLAPLLRLQREVREIALDFVRTDGSRLSALVNAVVRSDPQSRSSVVRMTVFDASDRREYERELLRERRRAERNADRLRILQEMVVRCASVGEVDEIVAAVRDAGAQAFGATGATVWLPGPGDVAAPSPGDLAAPSPGDLAAPSPGDLAAPSPGTPEARAVAEQGVVLYEPARPGPGDARLRAVTPLLAEGRPLGTVSFGFAEARPLDGDELELMGTLGRQAGQALERARLQREAARRGRQATFLARTGRELDEVVGFDERAGRRGRRAGRGAVAGPGGGRRGPGRGGAGRPAGGAAGGAARTGR
jgi:serine/threonine-protein kinase RsbW